MATKAKEAARAERLAILSEEMAEAIQVIAKIQRHGWDNYNPTPGRSYPRNHELLARELSDVKAAISMCIEAGDFTAKYLRQHRQLKLQRIGQWLRTDENKKLAESLAGVPQERGQ